MRVGLVGLGRWGRNYLTALTRSLGGVLSAICDDSLAAIRVGREVAPDARPFDSIHALLSADLCDAVVLATPSASHGLLGLDVLDAGVHLLIEKPLALSLPEAERLARVAEQRGLVLAVGHLSLHHPAVAALVARARAGALGTIERVEAWRTSNGAKVSRESALWSLAPHDVAAVIEIFGGLPEVVEARVVAERGGVPDAVELELRFPTVGEVPHERRARLYLSRLEARCRRELVVTGRRGTAELDEAAGSLVVSSGRGRERVHLDALPAPLDLQIGDFLGAISDRRAPRSGARAGVAVVRVLAAAERSLASSRPEPVGAA